MKQRASQATAEVGVVEIESRWTADGRNERVLNVLESRSGMPTSANVRQM